MDPPGAVLIVGKREENRADTVAYLMELISPQFPSSLLGCHSSKSQLCGSELQRPNGSPGEHRADPHLGARCLPSWGSRVRCGLGEGIGVPVGRG